MGHVDHGKTSCSMRSKSARHARRRPAGITATIGPYRVTVKESGMITCLATRVRAFTSCGPAAQRYRYTFFWLLRPMPDVRTSNTGIISHTKAAKVPFVVALNKIEKPGVKPGRREARTRPRVSCEDWGGDTVTVEGSAKTGQNPGLASSK